MVDYTIVYEGFYQREAKVVQPSAEVITYEVRLRRPEVEELMQLSEMFTVQAMVEKRLAEKLSRIKGFTQVLFAPMGCGTGFSLVVISPLEEVEPEKTVASALYKSCEEALQIRRVDDTLPYEYSNFDMLVYTEDVESDLKMMKTVCKNLLDKGLSSYERV